MNQAMSHMENVAELLKSADSAVLDDSGQTINLLNTEYALVSVDQKQYTLYFNNDWENCSEQEAAYTLLIQGSDLNSKKYSNLQLPHPGQRMILQLISLL